MQVDSRHSYELRDETTRFLCRRPRDCLTHILQTQHHPRVSYIQLRDSINLQRFNSHDVVASSDADSLNSFRPYKI